MAPPEGNEPTSGYGPDMKVVGAGILVMGISLAIVIILYISFGHIGSTFSAKRMLDQQAELRQQYGLKPIPPVPDKLLLIPPSERNLTGNEPSAGANATGNGTK